MPAQYSRQSWARGFPPLFQGPYPDQDMRVSDAERQAVTDRLAEHFGDGRLDQAEFDERAGRAMSAKTRADLSGLFADLPDTGDLPGTGAPAVPGCPRRGHRHPVLLIALVVVLAIMAAHAVLWVTVPWLWIGFLAVILLFATGTIGHSRCGQDRPGTGDGEHRPGI